MHSTADSLKSPFSVGVTCGTSGPGGEGRGGEPAEERFLFSVAISLALSENKGHDIYVKIGGITMKDTMKKLVDFAGSWNLKLEIHNDVDFAGKHVHCMSMVSDEGGEDTNRVFFWVIPGEEKLCLYVPLEPAVEELGKQYGIELEELALKDLPENMRAVCMKIRQLDLENFLNREFIQHMMGTRAEQLGLELRTTISGWAGGCGGV
jgi:hypothetical protein